MDYIVLTKNFFDNYPNSEYPEFLTKINRPYILIKVTIGKNEFAIPLRSHLKYNKFNCSLKTREGSDSKEHCGLDFTKAILITDLDYYSYNIKGKKVVVEDKDHKVFLNSKTLIETTMKEYIERFKKKYPKRNIERNNKFCRYSTLQYYTKELGL